MNNHLWTITAKWYYHVRSIFPFRLILKAENRQLQTLLGSLDLSDQIVIDLGTGTGNALQFCEQARFAMGIDANLAMLQLARKNHEKKFFIQADVIALPLKSGFAGLVLAVGLSEYLRDLDAFFEEIARILSDRGSCIITYSPIGLRTLLRSFLGHKIYPRCLAEIVQIAAKHRFAKVSHRDSWMQGQILFQKTDGVPCCTDCC